MQKGDLAEAKGPCYEWLIRAGGKPKESVMKEFSDRAERQLRTTDAAGRGLKWYFAEPYAAEEVRREFKEQSQKNCRYSDAAEETQISVDVL